MRKKLYILLGLLFVVLVLNAQYDELRILLTQAKTHENRNQFTRALEIYQELYAKYPDNETVLEPYLNALYLNSDLTTAENVLDNVRNRVSPFFYQKQEVILMIKKNNLKQAEKATFDWLNKNSGQMQHYRDFARIFESSRLFDISIKIYLKARTVANDDNLHSFELSNAHYFLKNIELFFDESIKHLKLNPSHLYFYRNRFNEFLIEDKSRISLLKKYIDIEKDTESVIELYAFSLIVAEDFISAGEVYERLPVSKIIRFADDLKTDNRLDYSLNTYEIAMQKANRENKPEKFVTIADIRMKIAGIYFEQNRFDEVKTILMQVINEKSIQKSPWNFRTQANKESRLLMALIAIIEEKDIRIIKSWFDQAATFAFNQIERAEIAFQLSRYLYLTENYNEAYSTIEQAVRTHDVSSNIFKMSYFYRYEIALFQNSPAKDSLLVECMIHFPEDNRINDMLFLETFMNNLNQESKLIFLQALRYKGLYREFEAVNMLLKLAFEIKSDESYILAHEWANTAGINLSHADNDDKKYDLQNQVLKDYYFLLYARNVGDSEYKRNILKDFLTNNPQNTFSPQLRFLLFKAQKTET